VATGDFEGCDSVRAQDGQSGRKDRILGVVFAVRQLQESQRKIVYLDEKERRQLSPVSEGIYQRYVH
jgi:hypothetical protein